MSENNRYDSTRDAWEDIWDGASIAVEMQAVNYRRARQQIEAYLPYLNKYDTILEAGSGLNAVVITLRRMGYSVIGMDYAQKALEVSKQHDASLPLLTGDVHALPHADNSLGAYLSFGVLEHFEQGMRDALAEAYRVVKKGGILVLTIPYPNIIWKIAQWRREQQGRSLIDEDFYESTYTRQQLIDEVTTVGFDVVKAIPISHSYTLWGLHPMFRGEGYYETNTFAELTADVLNVVMPWQFAHMTMVIARK